MCPLATRLLLTCLRSPESKAGLKFKPSTLCYAREATENTLLKTTEGRFAWCATRAKSVCCRTTITAGFVAGTDRTSLCASLLCVCNTLIYHLLVLFYHLHSFRTTVLSRVCAIVSNSYLYPTLQVLNKRRFFE